MTTRAANALSAPSNGRDTGVGAGRSRPVVICAVGGGHADEVVRHAQELSAALGAELVLAHVAQSSNPARDGIWLPFDPSTYRAGALERGAAVLERAGGEALDAGARARLGLGPWPARIVELAAAEHAALVVAGRPRRAALGARHIARLLRRCPCPVIFLPPEGRPPESGMGRPTSTGQGSTMESTTSLHTVTSAEGLRAVRWWLRVTGLLTLLGGVALIVAEPAWVPAQVAATGLMVYGIAALSAQVGPRSVTPGDGSGSR